MRVSKAHILRFDLLKIGLPNCEVREVQPAQVPAQQSQQVRHVAGSIALHLLRLSAPQRQERAQVPLCLCRTTLSCDHLRQHCLADQLLLAAPASSVSRRSSGTRSRAIASQNSNACSSGAERANCCSSKLPTPPMNASPVARNAPTSPPNSSRIGSLTSLRASGLP